MQRAITGWRIVGLVVLAGAGAACAAATAPPHGTLDRDFRCIQVHEARIERGRATVDAPGASCADSCAAAAEARLSDRRLCRIALHNRDPDARARCELADRNTVALVTRADARCRCAR